MTKSLDHIKHRLSNAGLKSTHQRLVILDALLKMENHPTAENLYEILKPKYPSLSLGTVYKTLEVFLDNQLIKKVSSIDNQMRYDAKVHHHNHLYLENTKEIVDFEDEELVNLINTYLQSKNFENIHIKDVQIQINADKIDVNKNISIQ